MVVTVVTETSEPVRRRRHGKQLESALLAAGWDELVEAGYARLTMESVAVRARTSEPVLYRRWANKDQLVLAAIQHHSNANPVAVPDTGALRSDLLAQLTAVSEALAGFYAITVAAAFSGLLADTGLTPAQAREQGHRRPGAPAGPDHLPARPRPRRDRPRAHPPSRARPAVRPGAPRPDHGPQATEARTHPVDRRRTLPAPRAALSGRPELFPSRIFTRHDQPGETVSNTA